MLISHQKQFIFFKVPKTASQSILKCLKPFIDTIIFESYSSNTQKKHNHIPVSQAKKYISPDQFNTYYKFCFTRNPYERIVSEFCHQTKLRNDPSQKGTFEYINNLSFDEFLSSLNLSPQERLTPQYQFAYLNGENVMNFVGRFENLQNDFSTVCSDLGLANLKLPSVNKTSHGHFTNFYTPSLKQIIYNRYKTDFDLFNYEHGL